MAEKPSAYYHLVIITVLYFKVSIYQSQGRSENLSEVTVFFQTAGNQGGRKILQHAFGQLPVQP